MAGGRPVRSWAELTAGYRCTLVTGAFACLFTLITNVAVTIWAATLPDIDQDGKGRRVLFQGSCDTSRDLNAVLHLVINILSSILLGASNYGMQCLSSPTREQVDKAHSSGDCLDIGTISLKNLTKQTRATRTLWCILALSSVPLHLLYNSVIFSSVTIAPEYYVIAANEQVGHSLDALLSREKNRTSPDYEAMEALRDISAAYRDFEKLTPSECIDAYATSFLTSRSDVILVHETLQSNESKYLAPSLDNVGAHLEMYSWVCWGHDGNCVTSIGSIRNDAEHWAPFDERVQYCLSRPLPQQLCRVNYNIYLAVAIIGVNCVKLMTLIYTTLRLSPDRLLVLGDAIQSFLSWPDLSSRQSCLASIRQHRNGPNAKGHDETWAGPRTLVSWSKRWSSTVNNIQLGASTFLYLVSFGVSLFLLLWGINGLRVSHTFETLQSLGFGQPNGQALLMRDTSVRSDSPNIVGNAVLANIPHLTFSVIYFQWNAIFTRMLMGREWNNFSRKRAALRVSETPRGAQRTGYFLQLPYKVSVPLILLSILLHWIMSQCIFVVSIEVLENLYELGDDMDRVDISWGLVTCGYSPIAIMTCLLVSIIIPISVLMASILRLPGPMPVAGSCSLAIAAACHHPDGNAHPDVALAPLAWGVMVDWRKQKDSRSELDKSSESSSLTDSSYQHCGFSDGIVEDPQEGMIYA